MKIKLVKKILADNEAAASQNRRLFQKKPLLCVNLLSGPGAGKTTILLKTAPLLAERFGLRTAVIEGDIEGDLDGARLDRAGIPVLQLNTGGACHLDASMIQRALADFPLQAIDILFIENVGNLVCPAGFDLGEDFKVVVLSLPEGDDKPVKYPAMFRYASVLLLNKLDLAPYVSFSLRRIHEVCRRLNPDLKVFPLSALTGDGIDRWCADLADRHAGKLKTSQTR